MTLEFAKMQGLGNDFVVIDGVRQDPGLTPERVQALADRRFGVGCDQVLVLEPTHWGEAEFAYRIFNADGGKAEQCGNGMRCLARFAREAGLSSADPLRLTGAGGTVEAAFESGDRVGVDMGEPRLDGAAIPLSEPGEWIQRPVAVEGREWSVTAVSMGNPHCVVEVPEAEDAPLESLGLVLEYHRLFPHRANVELVQVLGSDRLRVRVWERGTGVTLACGTGACAAQVAARLWGRIEETAEVILDGGSLTVSWSGRGASVRMVGPAELVFWGRLSAWPSPRPGSPAKGPAGRGASL